MKKGVDHIGNCVVFYCHDGKGNFVMNKRSNKSRDDRGRWDPGGGSIEVGETVLQALKREVKEEYCVDIIEHEFLGYTDVFRVNEDGRKTHWIAFDFKVLVDPKKVKNGDPIKHDEIGWFTLDKLPKPTHTQMPKFVKMYKDRLK